MPELESKSTVLVGVGAGVSKICLTPMPALSRKLSPSADDDFGRTVMHAPKSVEKHEGKESVSV